MANEAYLRTTDGQKLQSLLPRVFLLKMLEGFLKPGDIPLSCHSCMAQLSSSQLLGRDQCFLHLLMAYGHCLVTCTPLCHGAITHQAVCAWLVAGTWLAGSLPPALHTIINSHLVYCGPRHIHHFSGVPPAFLDMACLITELLEPTLLGEQRKKLGGETISSSCV